MWLTDRTRKLIPETRRGVPKGAYTYQHYVYNTQERALRRVALRAGVNAALGTQLTAFADEFPRAREHVGRSAQSSALNGKPATIFCTVQLAIYGRRYCLAYI